MQTVLRESAKAGIIHQKTLIASCAKQLVEEKIPHKKPASLPPMAIVIGVIVGLILGVGASELRHQITQKSDAQVANWAKSSEGQLAGEIVRLNPDLKSCEKEAQALNQGRFGKKVTRIASDGRTAKNGFCVIWTLPKEKIQWK